MDKSDKPPPNAGDYLVAELGLAVTVIGGPFTITLSIKMGCALQASEPDRLEKSIGMGYAAGEAAACRAD